MKKQILLLLLPLLLLCGNLFADKIGSGPSGPQDVVHPLVVDMMSVPPPPLVSNILAQTHKRGLPPDQDQVIKAKNTPLPVRPYDPQLTEDISAGDNSAAFTLIDSWAGPNFNGWQPPDCDIAVGPLHVMVVTNEQYHIYDRTSNLNLLTSSTFQSFFPGGTGTSIFDPKVFYDPWALRWIFIALQRSGLQSFYRVAVSQTSSPTGLWWTYTLNAHVDGSTSTNNWADYPGLGFTGGSLTTGAVVLTSNQYNQSDAFQYAKIRILKRSQLYAGAAVTWHDFWNMNNSDASKAFTLKPAQNWFGLSQVYLLNTKSGGWDKLTLWRIDNPTDPAPALVLQNTVNVTAYAPPPDAPMLGGGTFDAFDCRTQDVIYSNGSLFTSLPYAFNWGAGNNSNIRFYDINRSTGALNREPGTGSSGFWYVFPDVAPQFRSPVFGTDSVGIAFSRGASSIYPESRVIGFAGTSNLGSVQTQAGTGNLGGGSNRFGDYTGIAIDAKQNGHFWSASERGRAGSWGTGIGYFAFFNVTTNITGNNGNLPDKYSLSQNYPNPFNPATRIMFSIPEAAYVKLSVYDMLGREIKTLFNGDMQAGSYETVFSAENLSSGVYFYKLEAGDFVEIKRMMLNK